MAPGYPEGPAPSPAPLPDAARIRDNLARLADVLGVPVSAFSPEQQGRGEAVLQAANLVTVFSAIENPAARRTCLAFVRAMASS
ncbi:hypothetical protein MKK88_15550 [Methylobacterium sp. E-005]|uniref:hypothetical protein n=1 Tax=Methylobacterium sp. E-005 TaxID=2836549 RepID=UPI001FB9BD77|nr:hypothetical protein [Methylobacterium sp. E-005]MCJ2087389.1 hypothetical protein [Methylobacterium sp. E-005]